MSIIVGITADMRMSVVFSLLLGVFFTIIVVRERHIHKVAQNPRPYSVVERLLIDVHFTNVTVWDTTLKTECQEVKLGEQKVLKSFFDNNLEVICWLL